MISYRSPKYRGGCYVSSGFFAVATPLVSAAAVLSGFWCALTGSSGLTGGGDLEELG